MNQINNPNAFPIGDKVIELMVAKGMDLDDLSMKTGIANESLASFFMSKEPVTQYFADELAKVFSPLADYWINLDRAYRNKHKRVNLV